MPGTEPIPSHATLEGGPVTSPDASEEARPPAELPCPTQEPPPRDFNTLLRE